MGIVSSKEICNNEIYQTNITYDTCKCNDCIKRRLIYEIKNIKYKNAITNGDTYMIGDNCICDYCIEEELPKSFVEDTQIVILKLFNLHQNIRPIECKKYILP